MFKRYLLTAIAACLVTACGTPQIDLTPESRSNIKAAVVSPKVITPNEIIYTGRLQAILSSTGAIGIQAAKEAEKTPAGQLVAAMKSNNIEIDSILKQEFIRAAEKSTRSISFSNSSAKPDAEISFQINYYGFGIRHGFSSSLYPTINAVATLKSLDGKILWQQREFITPLNGANKYGYSQEEFLAKPELIRESLARACAIWSELIFKTL